ncbi:DUF2000 domain-containing protein [Pseudoalteromonas sp. PS1M3]|jgi:hypothetical protein|uniref:DUF2000 domain-containing protein n=1 Tax=unclassified Pseudoalteromonas TaxID=194690 RepID=UPI00110BAD31|nr:MULTISPECIES: DUF2000 domain-containing protein [unclassified Pseudoalteromonas]TMP50596.1 DUF2000 domain-containing protein [Pseudoalteromonas sp. S1688]TMS79814.1 DUF2000 domain-containing protein [Pseudoalteromonas sp. S554]BBW93810.1 DUF2000 domain-containing protein [Pseudoalteromonas sp. PS1M3]|tara:strand:+ start:5640 stop:6053 length:414 start_codon:yes stop_codon:yes gene_type:complete
MSIERCAIIIDKNLPIGLIANTAAILTLSLGKLKPELIGEDINDYDGKVHKGITTIPIPILTGDGSSLSSLRQQLREYEPDLIVIDFNHAAQMTKNYEDYSNRLSEVTAMSLEYLGIAIYGNKKIVNKFTGNLGLLR